MRNRFSFLVICFLSAVQSYVIDSSVLLYGSSYFGSKPSLEGKQHRRFAASLRISALKCSYFNPKLPQHWGSKGPLHLINSHLYKSSTVKTITSIKSKARSFGDLVRNEARMLQSWLENLYEMVDYEAALSRAGVNFDGEIDDMESDIPVDAVAENPLRSSSEEVDNVLSSETHICEGKEGETTYGEMDLAFFVALLRRINPSPGLKFVDLGSGRGQLVLAAAKMFPWQLCTGIEIMPEVFEIGQGALEVACSMQPPISDCQFFKADIYNFTLPLQEADIVFAYATCFTTSDGCTLSKLSRVLADNVRKGSTIITVNKR
jgi:SAM-dependent methyltransferase